MLYWAQELHIGQFWPATPLPMLVLRIPTDFRKPPPGRACEDYEVVSVTTRWLLGRISKEQMAEGWRWRWSITSEWMWDRPSSGYTDTLEDAQQEFATAWRQWLSKTGRDENTHRPLFGMPVDIGNASP